MSELRMLIGNATLRWEHSSECLKSWYETSNGRISREYPLVSVYRKPMMEAYNEIWRAAVELDADIVSYMHDDVIIHEPNWDLRVLKEFEDPTVGAVGFFGGLGHCLPDTFTKPFDPYSFVRLDTISNLVSDETGGTEAEANGVRHTGECDVAVYDGLAIFIRRSILDLIGGWPQDRCLGYWSYDMVISALVRRAGYRLRYVGVKVNHLGGKSPSILWEGQPVESINADWLESHKYMYDHLGDVLPYRVK